MLCAVPRETHSVNPCNGCLLSSQAHGRVTSPHTPALPLRRTYMPARHSVVKPHFIYFANFLCFLFVAILSILCVQDLGHLNVMHMVVLVDTGAEIFF